LRDLVERRTLLCSVIFLLLGVLITLWMDYKPITLIPIVAIWIFVSLLFINRYKIQSFSYISLISGLVSLLLFIIWANNPASNYPKIIELTGYYTYYFGVVGYTFGIVSLFLEKRKLSIVLSWIGILAASPAFLFFTVIRIFGWI